MTESANSSSGAGARIPVYAVWQRRVGPVLSVGMLTAAARQHRQGALNEVFCIEPPIEIDEYVVRAVTERGPSVLLCSDYVWSMAENVDAARRVKASNPSLLVIHGGPSVPRSEHELGRFFETYGDVADIVVRGEGEDALCEILDVLAVDAVHPDEEALSGIDGIAFRRRSDATVVVTPERTRRAELAELPSPYLSGEFDHIDPSAWFLSANIETNRGCPYGCTFCDWGSATNSRIRMFPVDRVVAEVEWAAERGIPSIQFCDANFGITRRDAEIAERVAEIHGRLGGPAAVALTPAKNTTRHITRILDSLMDAGIRVSLGISLQTTDPTVLAAVERSNISTEAYLELAAALRVRGVAPAGDVLIGLPEQTYPSFKADLQFFLDHEIMARTWLVQLLPNAPMNAPEYRERHGIRADERHIVTSTASFDELDRARMLRLRNTETVLERHGVLRHVLRFLQWDHGIAATSVMERLGDRVWDEPHRWPALGWLLSYFDLFPTMPLTWQSVYDEVARFAESELDVDLSSGLQTALAVQQHLMPAPGRCFPSSIELAHDYVTYYRSATIGLYQDGRASLPAAPLESYPPATFTVDADPLGLCSEGLQFVGDSRDETLEGDFHTGMVALHELRSPLTRLMPGMSSRSFPLSGPDVVDRILRDANDREAAASPMSAVSVAAPSRRTPGGSVDRPTSGPARVTLPRVEED